VVRPERLERVVEEAERLGLFDGRAVERLLARNRGRRGVSALRAAMAVARPDSSWTRSALERRFLDLCRDAALPPPAVNVWVAGHEVDMVWLDRHLVVELDGYAFHRTRAAFERDRARDAALQVAGFRVMRLSPRRLEADEAGILADVEALLRS
jgi:Protein of unknown function (DUF559)